MVDEAAWYFNSKLKSCRPFYYSGCGGNENRFDSLEECEEACPNAFPPEIKSQAKVMKEYKITPLFLFY